MTRRELLLGTLFFCCTPARATHQQDAKGNLRLRSLSSETYHAIPFTTTLGIEIDPRVDRQPTMREYDGIEHAAEKWFSADAEEIYGPQGVSVYRTLCSLTNAKWRPYRNEDYSHTMVLDCEITLVADVQDRDAVPSVGQFLLDTSAYSSVMDLVETYLQRSGGSPSVFQYVDRATYATYERGAYQVVDSDTNEEVSTSLGNLYAMTFTIDWNFVLGQEQPLTEDDYNYLVQATQSWLTISIEDFYKSPNSFRLSQVSSQPLGQPSWNNSTRHSMKVGVMIVWKTNAIIDVPTPEELLKDMSAGFNLGSFLTNWLEQGEGIFRDVREVSYGTTYSSPNPDPTLEEGGVPIGIPVEGTNETFVSVSFNMTLTYGLDRGDYPFGQTPTEPDWTELLQATISFLHDGLVEHYANNNSTMLEDVSAEWVQTQYRPWETVRPYRARLGLTLLFTEDSLLLPAAYDYKFLLTGILGSNLDEYISEYLDQMESDSLFGSVERVSWGF